MLKNQKPTFPLIASVAVCLWILFVNIVFFAGRVDQSSILRKLSSTYGFLKP